LGFESKGGYWVPLITKWCFPFIPASIEVAWSSSFVAFSEIHDLGVAHHDSNPKHWDDCFANAQHVLTKHSQGGIIFLWT
jgi:hypothetical protein